MALQKLVWAELAVTDIDQALEFNVNVLGLREVGREGRKVYLSCDIEDPHAQLVLTEGGTGVRSFALGVDSECELEQFESRLAAIDVKTERRSDAAPEQPTIVTFQLPTGHEVVLLPRPDRPLYRHQGFDKSSQRLGVGPADIDHITIAFSKDSEAREVAYVLSKGLGFKISDIFLNADDEWQAAWTRAGEVHHDVGLIRCQPGASLHHLAWTVDNMEHQKRAADTLASAGHLLETGPGRHGVGGNLYSYLWTPGGNRYELSAEMPRILGENPDPIVRKAGDFDAFSAWGATRPESFTHGS
ncbi:VOC family protein [Rhodococcus sp. IEGM 1307]|uniref:VOC family protein n=1 Tax=Rhodococcus sp. IEGM 1307 TaxID=3047091 RepID=UPI0024B6AC63|nr:VOC family protein [Rhodococcus sp. IEGM 1307]MDI9979563.1 VOC family protein [Rhodococcus sp. IEGM 1307]